MSDGPVRYGDELIHIPVMPAEVAEYLITDPNGVYIDATVGGGGHAKLIADKLTARGRLIGCDRDATAVARARQRLNTSTDSRVTLVQSDYAQLAHVCRELGVEAISGALFDLGLSSIQLNDPDRGFAYSQSGPLDLRFDQAVGQSAAAWLKQATQPEIESVLKSFGEEPKSRAISRALVRQREEAPVETTAQLWSVLSKTVGARMPQLGRTAARVWQALRIQVNSELQSVPLGINAALDTLVVGGRVVVIAYHSLEDRIAKDIFRSAAKACTCPPVYPQCMCGANQRGHVVNRRVLRPTADEVASNPRARSARMRVFEKDVLKPGRGAV